MQHLRCIVYEEREHTCHQIHACNHHCGGVDQCADGSRTFHCIGQPDVQWEHGALSGSADEHQSQCQRNHGSAAFQQCHFIGLESIGSGIVAVDQNTDQEAQIGKTGNDECLFAGGYGCRFGIVETNQQVGRYAHQFPKQIHLEDVRRHHESEHGHGEKRKKGIITLKTALTFHVAEGVEVYHE
ncbi:uncharacterized protein BN464_02056 [Bacteroides eggerthii CAG:109]|nr:uncharacterized protein BN464_02056 [Bacteroides eggerthii CAG:109]